VVELWDRVVTGARFETVPVPEGTVVVMDTVVIVELTGPELPLLTELLLAEDPPPPPPPPLYETLPVVDWATVVAVAVGCVVSTVFLPISTPASPSPSNFSWVMRIPVLPVLSPWIVMLASSTPCAPASIWPVRSTALRVTEADGCPDVELRTAHGGYLTLTIFPADGSARLTRILYPERPYGSSSTMIVAVWVDPWVKETADGFADSVFAA
jgi:hypothetical protein